MTSLSSKAIRLLEPYSTRIKLAAGQLLHGMTDNFSYDMLRQEAVKLKATGIAENIMLADKMITGQDALLESILNKQDDETEEAIQQLTRLLGWDTMQQVVRASILNEEDTPDTPPSATQDMATTDFPHALNDEFQHFSANITKLLNPLDTKTLLKSGELISHIFYNIIGTANETLDVAEGLLDDDNVLNKPQAQGLIKKFDAQVGDVKKNPQEYSYCDELHELIGQQKYEAVIGELARIIKAEYNLGDGIGL